MFDYDDHYKEFNYENAAKGGPYTGPELKWSLRLGMSWHNLEDNVIVLPQHIAQANLEIEKHLGYQPQKIISFRHEPFIRALIEEQKLGKLALKKFNDAVAVHVRHIRNDDMQRSGWASPYSQMDYERYETHLVKFKDRARARLLKGLDEEPKLDYSLDAEMILREQFLCDWFSDGIHLHTAFDCKAYTILFYRMALSEAGLEVANETDLMGIF